MIAGPVRSVSDGRRVEVGGDELQVPSTLKSGRVRATEKALNAGTGAPAA